MPNLNKPTVLWLAQLASCLSLLALLPLAAVLALFALLALLGLLLWVLLSPLAQARRWCLALGLSCLIVLSGCGTVPYQPVTCPRVPAAFLLPPARPTLLAPQAQASGLKTPGPTTAPTPAAVPQTAPGTTR